MNCPFHSDDGALVVVTPQALQSANAVVYVCAAGHVYERVDSHARLIHACQR